MHNQDYEYFVQLHQDCTPKYICEQVSEAMLTNKSALNTAWRPYQVRQLISCSFALEMIHTTQPNPDTAMVFSTFGCINPTPPVPPLLLTQNQSQNGTS